MPDEWAIRNARIAHFCIFANFNTPNGDHKAVNMYFGALFSSNFEDCDKN